MNIGRQELMMKIQEAEFVCIELNLYLDTHPDDEDAQNDFNCYSQKLKLLIAKYEREYGPLMNFGHSLFENGNWVESPWPWEA